jgi:hypothetical protein
LLLLPSNFYDIVWRTHNCQQLDGVAQFNKTRKRANSISCEEGR